METQYFIGIDISKKSLNWAVCSANKIILEQVSGNDIKSITKTVLNIQRELKFKIASAVFCMEHTGIYHTRLLKYLQSRKASIWLESGSQIKYSMGDVRGKSDVVDAQRIARYAYKNRDEIKLYFPPRAIVDQLDNLLDIRDRLVKVRQICLTALNEQKSCEANKTLTKDTKKYSAHTLKGVETDLQTLEKQIKELIDSDPKLKSLFENITSIPGVGIVTAAKCIVITDEFKKFDNAKQLACHAGVVPFENSSGTSLQSKPRVSKKAHKGIKATLSNCVMSAMRYNTHFKAYYERKLKEGKNKFTVFNAMKNKLVRLIFSLAKQGKKYDVNYTYSLV
jgi:transposase